MNPWIGALALAITQIGVSVAHAQSASTPQEKAAARAERRIEGSAAARNARPGEGDPKPAPQARPSAAERAAARTARTSSGAAAAKAVQPGEGTPVPEAKPRLTAQQRAAAAGARRAEVRRENKAGEIPTYGEGYGGKK